MKVIFLDVDGVLNYKNSAERCGKYVGIDENKVKLLAHLVKKTGAKVVLISTWKHNWYKIPNKNKQDDMANYLDEKFRNAGIALFNKTPDRDQDTYLGRGEGIVVYVHDHGVDGFAILDDCQYDYDACDLTEFWVMTDSTVGLTAENVELAAILIEKGWR